MPLICKVIEKDQKVNATSLTLGFPDESGPWLTVPVDVQEFDQLVVGQSYTLAFSPQLAADNATPPPIEQPEPGNGEIVGGALAVVTEPTPTSDPSTTAPAPAATDATEVASDSAATGAAAAT
jgi:hypothetical protein